MKRTVILFVVLMLVVVGGTSAIRVNEGRCRSQELAIAAVFAEHRKACQNSYVVRSNGGGEHQKFSPRIFLRQLKAIKTDGCPEDFRFAWLGYIQTCDRFIAPSPVQRQEDTQIKRAMLVNFHAVPGIGLDVDNRESGMEMAKHLMKRNCQEVWHRCESVALRHGVQGY
jgi:hypothetical protein